MGQAFANPMTQVQLLKLGHCICLHAMCVCVCGDFSQSCISVTIFCSFNSKKIYYIFDSLKFS